MLHRRTIFAAAAGLLLIAAAPARAADVTPDDAARFLAGMPPSAESPLAPLTQERAWQQHARFFDSAFGKFDQRQLARIRAWSGKHLTASRPTMFYMFSGPDFLYADAFFPNATTYVLSGLEPVGAVPDLSRLRGSVAPSLRQIQSSLSSILSYSFFITKHMKSDLRAGQVNGTLPILYVFLARSGKTIREVAPVRLDDQGAVHPDTDPGPKTAARGVKIVFAGSDGAARTLYYFSTNLADDGVRSSGFLKFCETLAPGDSLVKSASYLLHSGGFKRIRDFLLANSAAMVQDDSGIPLAYYDARKWELHPFGRYLGPIGIFPGRHQANLAALFRKSQPIDFGIGYRWRPNESNLLLAVRKPSDSVPEASSPPAPQSPAPQTQASETETTATIPPKRRAAARPRRAPPPQQAPGGLLDWFFTPGPSRGGAR